MQYYYQLPRWSNTKLLVEGEPLYKIVKAHFMSGIGFHEPNVKITAIHQWVHSDPIDRTRTIVFFKEVERMKLARGGEANLTFGWLRTLIEGVNGILRDGFVASCIFGSQAHGIGVYLSHLCSPHMSALLSEVDDYREKHVVLCRVVLGRREEIEAGSQQLYPSHRYFDTGVDDLWNPKRYIVWSAGMNTRILPECVEGEVAKVLSCSSLRVIVGGKDAGLKYS
ncbi:hypothetical protein RHGRI_021689 [Rhododendron griersonianum]|uniref:PARP catalytic domain-containing protein n=1 Tax=Rhododendron griersonianum TaxID=479676 RepID=A0AAV6JPG5_9ERIC|nr:hypothetical protein RHGRI_021689 [Rhododendron griersonianum]